MDVPDASCVTVRLAGDDARALLGVLVKLLDETPPPFPAGAAVLSAAYQLSRQLDSVPACRLRCLS
ncbi:MAG: hypothetical protein ACRDZ6_03425 [Acidimicrobiales bacterium]